MTFALLLAASLSQAAAPSLSKPSAPRRAVLPRLAAPGVTLKSAAVPAAAAVALPAAVAAAANAKALAVVAAEPAASPAAAESLDALYLGAPAGSAAAVPAVEAAPRPSALSRPAGRLRRAAAPLAVGAAVLGYAGLAQAGVPAALEPVADFVWRGALLAWGAAMIQVWLSVKTRDAAGAGYSLLRLSLAVGAVGGPVMLSMGHMKPELWPVFLSVGLGWAVSLGGHFMAAIWRTGSERWAAGAEFAGLMALLFARAALLVAALPGGALQPAAALALYSATHFGFWMPRGWALRRYYLREAPVRWAVAAVSWALKTLAAAALFGVAVQYMPGDAWKLVGMWVVFLFGAVSVGARLVAVARDGRRR